MAQFRGTLQGARGAVSRLGTKKSGLVVAGNGWDTGARIEIHYNELKKRDQVSIYQTSGSGDNGGELIAEY